jgi:hypothetical protein
MGKSNVYRSSRISRDTLWSNEMQEYMNFDTWYITMVFRHVHAKWFLVMSMQNSFSSCPCKMVFRHVHAKWFFVMSMQNGFSSCPCKMVFRHVHAKWFFVTSMQNGFSSCLCKMVFRHIHAKWFFVASMYTSCPRFPVGNDLTSLRRRLVSKYCYTKQSDGSLLYMNNYKNKITGNEVRVNLTLYTQNTCSYTFLGF